MLSRTRQGGVGREGRARAMSALLCSIKNAIFNVDDYSMPQTHTHTHAQGVGSVCAYSLAISLAQLHVSFPPQTTPPHTKQANAPLPFFLVASPPVTSFASPLADRQPARGGRGRGRYRGGGAACPDSTFRCSPFWAQLKSKLAFSTHSASFFYQFHDFLFCLPSC